MKKQLIECVPNFSEGRDLNKIRQITDSIEQIRGIRLLHADRGETVNRTVVTFAGDPARVCEAAFQAIRTASRVIDMRTHHGKHPRIGATDVCPLVPVSNISMKETVDYAYALGYRVGRELSIPGYFYESAALNPARKNLSDCRKGEYEGLKKKLADPEWTPDFGPQEFNPKTGAIVIGARNYLIAYNINLNTRSATVAHNIACEIREKGRLKRMINNTEGEIKDITGMPEYIPGILKYVKGMGWYISEYGIAQISLNLTDFLKTPMHVVFEEACRQAEKYGVRVTGSEVIGLVPLKAILDAGRYFLQKTGQNTDQSEKIIIKTAIESLGLDNLVKFNPAEKILEYVLLER